ncbi:MAG: M23 family metallopeptidase [Oscillospiraceae bacterium]|jgi:murein DD-endopeptidase MepM/ murein hydrolase activator NlpD|nr:M23 family metallopeptidase [Oscillospiraceae bacterium]
MQLEEKEARRPRWRLPKGSGFYLALSLTVVAAGIGVWGAVSNSLSNSAFPVPDAGAQRSTINWANYVTRPVEESEAQANVPATNVPDERGKQTTAASNAKKENQPFTGSFALPFGTKINKDYSEGEMVKSLTMGDWRVHNGVDFAGEANAEVVAIQDGTVKAVVADPLWGIVLTIDHGSGIVAKYCGLSQDSTPKEGQDVKKGEPVGVIAQIPVESAEGIHLHLEITVNGKVADPLAVMNKTGE